jgi:hypothetical protein
VDFWKLDRLPIGLEDMRMECGLNRGCAAMGGTRNEVTALKKAIPQWGMSVERARTRTADILSDAGYAVVATGCHTELLGWLRETVFREGMAGTRCLLDHPAVLEAVGKLRGGLQAIGVLGRQAVAVQAIGFDKSASANWKVAWHQDLMFPLAHSVATEGYGIPCTKAGVVYARPPRAVLEAMVAVRLHVDGCDETNGPLRVSPGTHRLGILSCAEVAGVVERHGEVTCLAREGEALLLHPLTLHASSAARQPRHRRVLHVVFHSGEPVAEAWHRAV